MFHRLVVAFFLLKSCCLHSFFGNGEQEKAVLTAFSDVDLESQIDEFIIDSMKLEIPGYLHAFNPSIIRRENGFLICFRSISKKHFPHRSDIGFVWLDEQFKIVGKPVLLKNQEEEFLPSSKGISTRAEDIRLIRVGDKIHMIYNDYRKLLRIQPRCIRVHTAELKHDGEHFTAYHVERYIDFEGESKKLIEKNWTPFDFDGEMMMIYRMQPHKIFRSIGRGACETYATSAGDIDWEWGDLRGGTPALKIDEGHYLTFFHSMKQMRSLHSESKMMPHYFVGAYMFSSSPPFEITHMSPKPIVGQGFYYGKQYPYYWKPVVAIFPTGYVYDDNFIWLSYGRQDHESWIIKIDKKGLLDSLVPIATH